MSEAWRAEARLQAQAEELEQMLPVLMRRLFTLEPDHPAMELPLAQLRVCTILQVGPRTLSGLSGELGISVSAVTQLADRLDQAGLVERVPGVEDRRTKLVRLTQAGAVIMRERRTARINRVYRALCRIPSSERDAMLETIRNLLEAATETAPALICSDPIAVRQEVGAPVNPNTAERMANL